jgi:hypothetical protein
LKELETGFAEVENRVKALIEDKLRLKKRVAELEEELSLVRRKSEELEVFNGKRVYIREKIERILHSLEAVGEKGT